MGGSSHKQLTTTALWRIATPVEAGAIHPIPHSQDTGCVERDFGPVSLAGVQAAPLCMLVSDAVTDLLRGQPQPDHMRVSLVQEQAGTCVLTLAHSGGRAVKQAGIGAQLTEAFAIQLGGTIVRGLQPGNQTSLTVTFTPH